MYPGDFEYVAPTSKTELLSILAERGDEVKILAGGQSLIPMMKLRLARPATLVDINNIPGLDAITASNGHLSVQALVRHNDIVNSSVVKAENHLMSSTADLVADPLVRNRGTMCGSVAHHDPEGDWASVMLALNGTVIAESLSGVREIPISEFLVDFFETSLRSDELLTEVRVPRYTNGGGNYQKLERKIGDYATVGVATHLQFDDTGVITQAGIALTSVANSNLKVSEAESVLVGNRASEELFAEAAQIAKNACDPTSDTRGSEAYKRDIVRVFVERSLSASAATAGGAA